jgi:hypothetical protein
MHPATWGSAQNPVARHDDPSSPALLPSERG